MERELAIEALSALAQETRLTVFKLLASAGKDGVPAGEISDALEVRPNTLSTHLAILTQCRLVRAEKEGRTIRYIADQEVMAQLMIFLLQDVALTDETLVSALQDILPEKEHARPLFSMIG
jgi:ArsR family transcriptional regulator